MSWNWTFDNGQTQEPCPLCGRHLQWTAPYYSARLRSPARRLKCPWPSCGWKSNEASYIRPLTAHNFDLDVVEFDFAI